MRPQLLLTLAAAALSVSGCCTPPPTWSAPTTLTTPRLRIVTDEDDGTAYEVAREAQAFLERVEPWLGIKDDERIDIYLFHRYGEFQTKMEAKGEGITYFGCCHPTVGVPRWPLEMEGLDPAYVSAILESVGSDWRFRLRHELVHVIFRRAHGLDRDWLWEGIADYLAHEGQDGDGMKAQRFLSLKQASVEGRLKDLAELQSASINASRKRAELLYAEAWSVVFTLMNLCGPDMRLRFVDWLRRGAPGPLDELLRGSGYDLAAVDAERQRFIKEFQCFLEAREVVPGGLAHSFGLRSGDRLLRFQHWPVSAIDTREDLGTTLSTLLQPPPWMVRGGSVPCMVLRGAGLTRLELPVEALPTIRWRLTACRPGDPESLRFALTPLLSSQRSPF